MKNLNRSSASSSSVRVPFSCSDRGSGRREIQGLSSHQLQESVRVPFLTRLDALVPLPGDGPGPSEAVRAAAEGPRLVLTALLLALILLAFGLGALRVPQEPLAEAALWVLAVWVIGWLSVPLWIRVSREDMEWEIFRAERQSTQTAKCRRSPQSVPLMVGSKCTTPWAL